LKNILAHQKTPDIPVTQKGSSQYLCFTIGGNGIISH